MAKYTTELRTLLESGYDIGLKTYPIQEEAHRVELNKLLINHYYFREICDCSPDTFKFYLNAAMEEIMPYYNAFYWAEKYKFTDLMAEYESREDTTGNGTESLISGGSSSTSNVVNHNEHGTHSGGSGGTSTKTGKVTNDTSLTVNDTEIKTNTDVHKDFQVPITGRGTGGFTTDFVSSASTNDNNYKISHDVTTTGFDTIINNETDITNTDERGEDITNGSSSVIGSGSVDTTGKVTKNNTGSIIKIGHSTPMSELVENFRKSIINIDMEIVENKKIRECFMSIY